MERSDGVLDAKSVFEVSPGQLLVIQWHDEGARAGAAKILAAIKGRELVVAVWIGGTSFGGVFDVWRIRVEGRKLIESRKGFEITLRQPTDKERQSIDEYIKKNPAPPMPQQGEHVLIRYLDIEPGPELSAVVGTVKEQRFDQMAVEIQYFSAIQRKVIHEPVELDRSENRWIDRDVKVACAITVIDAAQLKRWLAEDEKAQKAMSGSTKPPTKGAAKKA